MFGSLATGHCTSTTGSAICVAGSDCPTFASCCTWAFLGRALEGIHSFSNCFGKSHRERPGRGCAKSSCFDSGLLSLLLLRALSGGERKSDSNGVIARSHRLALRHLYALRGDGEVGTHLRDCGKPTVGLRIALMHYEALRRFTARSGSLSRCGGDGDGGGMWI